MKNLTAVLLSVLLAIPAWASDSIEAKAQKIAIGTQVEVKLKNHQPIQGQMGEVFPGGFVVKIYDERKLVPQRVLFADVVAIKQAHNHPDVKAFFSVLTFVGAATATVVGIRSAIH